MIILKLKDRFLSHEIRDEYALSHYEVSRYLPILHTPTTDCVVMTLSADNSGFHRATIGRATGSHSEILLYFTGENGESLPVTVTKIEFYGEQMKVETPPGTFYFTLPQGDPRTTEAVECFNTMLKKSGFAGEEEQPEF